MAIFGGEHVPLSPEWWANKLEAALTARNKGRGWNQSRITNPRGTRPGLDVLDAWSRSEPPLPSAYTEQWVSAWAKFLRLSRTHFAELVVSSRTERIVPIGWRTAVDEDADGDRDAERIAVHSDLRVRAGDAIRDMLTFADGYLLVGPDPDDSRRAIITSESPLWTITAEDRATGRARAGLRSVVDEWTGEKEHWLYLADGTIRVARANVSTKRFEWSGDPAGVPGRRFPLVHLRNHRGVGEFEEHLEDLQRINDTLFTRIVLTKMQAFRQRAITRAVPKEGDAFEVDAEIKAEDFTPGPDALWDLPPGMGIWESQVTDMTSMRGMVEDDVKLLSATTKTPIWQMWPGAQNQSATGSEKASAGFVALVEDRRHRADVALAHAMSMAFLIEGKSDRAEVEKIRTIWAPAESYSLNDQAQAFSALYGKVPFDTLAIDVLGKRPSDLPALNAQRGKDMLFGATGAQS